MIYSLRLIMIAVALAVLAAQLHHLARLRHDPRDTAPLVYMAAFLGLILSEHYLHDGGDVLLALPTALILAMSAFAAWWEARRRARETRSSAVDVPQPRLIAEGPAEEK
jgi:hypothetical protein